MLRIFDNKKKNVFFVLMFRWKLFQEAKWQQCYVHINIATLNWNWKQLFEWKNIKQLHYYPRQFHGWKRCRMMTALQYLLLCVIFGIVLWSTDYRLSWPKTLANLTLPHNYSIYTWRATAQCLMILCVWCVDSSIYINHTQHRWSVTVLNKNCS